MRGLFSHALRSEPSPPACDSCWRSRGRPMRTGRTAVGRGGLNPATLEGCGPHRSFIRKNAKLNTKSPPALIVHSPVRLGGGGQKSGVLGWVPFGSNAQISAKFGKL